MSSPTSGQTSVTVLGMNQAQNVMQTMYGDFNTAMQDLQEQQSTLAANWSGEAQSAFGQALANFLDDFQTINNALVGMMDTLSQNTGIYVNTNDTSTAIANAFTNTTSGALTADSFNAGVQASGLTGF